MDYETALAKLAGCWDKNWDALTDEQREAWWSLNTNRIPIDKDTIKKNTIKKNTPNSRLYRITRALYSSWDHLSAGSRQYFLARSDTKSVLSWQQVAWLAEAVGLSALVKQKRLTGAQAATALTGFDPFKPPEGIECISTEVMSKEDYARLCSEFDGMAPRQLTDWLAYARETELPYHRGWDMLIPHTPQEVATIKPVPKLTAQEQAILESLRVMEVDPHNLPKNKPGKPGIKAAVWKIVEKDKQLFQSRVAFNKAWQRVRDDHCE